MLIKTLAAFGFKKQVIHHGEKVDVEIPQFASSDLYNKVACPTCPKRFKNNHGLSVHLKCVHGDKDDQDISQNKMSFEKSKNINLDTAI